jgi:hypothetical protein
MGLKTAKLQKVYLPGASAYFKADHNKLYDEVLVTDEA